jgi:lysophospholipase L1-like esterase
MTRSVPRGAWLLLILLLLPVGKRGPRPAATRRSPSAGLARAVGNALLVLVAVAVSLVAGELALRVAFHDEPWARSTLPVPAPGPPKRSPLNSLGFDEREVSLEKPPGVYRIAILGDSLSVSAPRALRFGSVIADRLNAHGPRPVTYEAVSFGRGGADTNHETEILQRAVWRTHPDFVLLEFYVNDLENGDHSGRPEGLSLIPGSSGPARWLRRATERTLLRRMLQAQFDILQERLGLAETYPAYMHRRFGDPAGVHWEAAAYELRDFIRECRAHDTPLAIALFPHLSAGLPAGSYEFAELHDQVLELCRAESVPCVDLRSTFAAYRNYTSLWVDRFDPHPNARAHRLAAERLLEVLGPLWLGVGRGPGAATRSSLSPGAPRGS